MNNSFTGRIHKLLTTHPLPALLILGLSLRLLFYFLGAELYYNKKVFQEYGDFEEYLLYLKNLANLGIYTSNPQHELGYFTRTPAYPVFLYIIFLLSGKSFNLFYPMLSFSQILLDTVNIFLIFYLCTWIYKTRFWAIISSLLFAVYPFAIVWTPVIHAESLTLFSFFLAFFLFFHPNLKYNYFYSGIFSSLCTLIRINMGLLLVIFPCLILLNAVFERKTLLKPILLFSCGALLAYLPWPLRNYINYKKLIFTQDISAFDDKSYRSCIQYLQTIKTDPEPQYSNIVFGRPVEFPKTAYISTTDSVLLEKVINLCRTCGTGFQHKPLVKDCNDSIIIIFNYLSFRQQKYNFYNTYLWVPLANLRKIFLKTNLNSSNHEQRSSRVFEHQTAGRPGWVNGISSALFLSRSLLIITGFAGAVLSLFFYKNKNEFFFAFGGLAYSLFWFLILSFIFRHMAMRYLICADSILLIFVPGFYIFLKNLFFRDLSEKT